MSAILDTFIAPPCHDEIGTLYQDEHLLLISKPSGLLSLPGKNPQNLDPVHHRLVQIHPGHTLVYRFDFGISGLMVVACNKAINTVLCQQFSQRTVIRVYSVLLYGHLENDEGVIDAAIARDPALFPLMSTCALSGKPAHSHYQIVERLCYRQGGGVLLPLTRVQLTPEIGCTYQLRIRCQQLGYPTLGCDLYGGRLLPGTEQTPRLMLHVSELHLRHPTSEAQMNVKNDSPFRGEKKPPGDGFYEVIAQRVVR